MKASKTIYRKCSCGETAHDMRATQLVCQGVNYGWIYTWACRNCRSEAKDRSGDTRVLIKRTDLKKEKENG